MENSRKNILKRAVSLVLVIGVFVILSGCSSPPHRPESISLGDYESTKEYISNLIQYEMTKQNVTGLSIALVDDQKIIWAKGFGYADKSAGIAVTPETTFRVGSISKLFTDTAVMQLAEQGKLDIDKPIQTYLPSFSIHSRFPNAGPITARNLMTHHSGLPGDVINGMWVNKPEPFSRLVDQIKDDYVAYPPNFIFSYSNLGITLLGDAVQKVSGEDFSSYLNQSLLQPIGMTHSSFSATVDAPLMSKGYRNGDEAIEPPLRDIPAGGLNSNVLDLSRFMQMVFSEGQSNGRTIIQPATLAEMLRPQNENVALDQDFRIGLGWAFGRQIKNAGIVVGHNGATLLHRSQLLVVPQYKLGVVVLANSPSAIGVVTDVAVQTLKLALEAKAGIHQPKSTMVESSETILSPHDLQTYPGSYATMFGYLKVKSTGQALMGELSNRSFDLIPKADGQFGLRYRLLGAIPWQTADLANINLSSAMISDRNVLVANIRGTKSVVGEKMVPQPISPKWMDRLGDYEIINAKGNALAIEKISLVTRDGFLVLQFSVPAVSGEPVLRPISIMSDTEAIILGLGRSLGETLRVVTIDGEEYASYSGYLFRKKKAI
jgi:CubicO group peptidase (beta-lactamase class C family)